MIIGNKIVLTAIEEEDLALLLSWRNRPDFRMHFREHRELNMAQQLQWFQNKVCNDDSTYMFAIRNIETLELLGCCGLCYINWIHRHADLSLYIGWGNEYIDSVGYAEEACKLLFSYAFGELSLNKIWTEIYEFDTKKISLYKKIGMKQDGLLRKNYFFDNKWWDSIILSILNEKIDEE